MKNKMVLWVIIISLVASVSLAGYGYYVHLERINRPVIENENKEFKYEGKLYFYDMSNNLINKYTCKNENCGYATNKLDDYSYYFNYYPNSQTNEITLIDYRYAFINDSASNAEDDIVLYDVKNQKEVKKFKMVKNYSVGLDNGYFIVKDETGNWGVVRTSNTAAMIIDCKYKFIGVTDRINKDTGHLFSDKFAVLDENGWKLISDTGADLTNYTMYQIYDYTDGYTITRNDSNYFLNSDDGTQLLSVGYKEMQFVSHYVKVLNDQGEGYFIDLNGLKEASQRYQIKELNDLETEETLNGIEVYLDYELVETLQ